MSISSSEKPRNILVTSALPYANGPIHLGHMLEYVQSDIWVRFLKLEGHNCYYVCADDAHGTAIMLHAEALNTSPETLIADVKREHETDFKDFLIHFDQYHSTHSDENQYFATLIYERNRDNGHIFTKSVTQLYDPEKQMFLADRYVKGDCPKCGASDQYGDNCEICGATYLPNDLKNPKSSVSGATPISKASEQLFFDISRFQPMLEHWLNSDALQPEVANKLKEWLRTGLKPWDISRQAPYFGFEVPDKPGTYFYVWLDAPVGYIASFKRLCQQNPNINFDAYWSSNTDTKSYELYHFIGKDIVNFHGLFWPAMLSGAEFRLPTALFAHGFVTVNGKKMSKSRGTFIKARTYLNHLAPEYLRYYFAAKLTDGVDDIDLNLEDFAIRVNSDLVGKYINIASRCAGFISKHFKGYLAKEINQPQLLATLEQAAKPITQYYKQREFAKAIRDIMALADHVNQYIDQQAPWQLIKSEETKNSVQGICTTGLNAFKLLTLYLKPVLPKTAAAVEDFLNCDELNWENYNILLLNHKINRFKPLIQRIDPKKIEAIVDESKSTANIKSKSKPLENNASLDQPICPNIEYDTFAQVDLRVVKIIKANTIAGADKLLELTLDLGDKTTRRVFAGIKKAYQPEQLEGKLTVMVANLKPRKMKFGLSEGMVLAAGPGGEEIFLLSLDSGAKPGMRIK